MPILYTIGYSNNTSKVFIDILNANQINHIVDVRTIPKSRHHLWTNQNNLKKLLIKNRISYTHLKKLGGFRHTSKKSINTGWINKSFQGFAD